jgi:GT2 family glycosyltransferase
MTEGQASVVVATCDRPAELRQCLASIRAQRPAPARIVVVDDAPGSAAATETVASLDDGAVPLSYIEAGGLGLAGAHNRALNEVETPITAFVDDDVVVAPGWFQAITDAFSLTPQVGCVTGKILPLELKTTAQIWLDGYAGYSKGERRRLFDLAEHRPDDPLFPFATGALGSGANMAFRTAALREMGGFDPALGAGTPARGGDDLAAFLEILLRGYTLVYEPAAVARHRHPSEYRALRRQVYGYGVGLAAYLTKSLVDHPRLLGAALRGLPRAAAHLLNPRSRKNARRPPGYPRELARLELRGMLAGPRAYLRSRASES